MAGRRPWLWALRIAVSAGLFIWIVSRLDYAELRTAFHRLPLLYLPAAFLMYLVVQAISSLRWKVLAAAVSLRGPWWAFLKIYFVGMYFNLFLPSTMGGDLIKIHLVDGGRGKELAAAYSTVSDRLFGLIALTIIGGAAGWLGEDLLPIHLVVILVLVGLGGVVLLFGLPLLARAANRFRPSLFKYIRALLYVRRSRRAFGAALFLSFVVQFVNMGMVMLLGRGLGIDLPAIFYFAVIPMVTVLTALPFSISGIGLREGAFVYFFGLKGVAPEQALTLGLLQFAVQVSASLVGGIIYGLGLHRRSSVRYEEHAE